jgi:hypothetical protein
LVTTLLANGWLVVVQLMCDWLSAVFGYEQSLNSLQSFSTSFGGHLYPLIRYPFFN